MRIAALKPVLAATTLLLLTHATQATTLTFSGIFDQRFGEELLFFSPGNPYSGAFAVAEPVTTGQIGSATSIALGASSFSYGVYDETVSSPGGLLTQEVFDGLNYSTWRAFDIEGTIGGHQVTQITFSANGLDLFSSPESPPSFSLNDLSLATFTLQISVNSGGTSTLRGRLQSMEFVEATGTTIPVPAALPLLLGAVIGLGAIGARRRIQWRTFS